MSMPVSVLATAALLHLLALTPFEQPPMAER
jgi:hypothetical protein